LKKLTSAGLKEPGNEKKKKKGRIKKETSNDSMGPTSLHPQMRNFARRMHWKGARAARQNPEEKESERLPALHQRPISPQKAKSRYPHVMGIEPTLIPPLGKQTRKRKSEAIASFKIDNFLF
jgi:hypothetical protein